MLIIDSPERRTIRKPVLLAALVLTGLFGGSLAHAQALRCVDAQGNVSYLGAGAPTAGTCSPLGQQTSSRDSREASARTEMARRITELQQECSRSISRSLFAPSTARFTLSPSGPSMPSGGAVLAGHVEVQNRAGSYLRREVWCEFSTSGALQHAFIEHDPAVLR